MKPLFFSILALSFGSCAVGVSGNARGEIDIVPLEPLHATMRPTADEISPWMACVNVNKGNDTYTVDPSGKVRA